MSKTSIPSRRELEKMGPVYEGLLGATDRARLALDQSAATLARANELAQGFTPKTAPVKNEIAAARAKHATCAQSLETTRAEARDYEAKMIGSLDLIAPNRTKDGLVRSGDGLTSRQPLSTQVQLALVLEAIKQKP